MEKLRILIVEDELIIAESLKIMLEGMGYHVPAIFTSGQETLEYFKPGFADVIIMDIQLADNSNGIDTSIEIRKISTAPIIYITDSKDEYLRKKAIYETNTVQFLTKPFTRLDISIAIDLAIKAIKGHKVLLGESSQSSYLINECVFVRDVQGFKKILINDIIFLKAEGSYCKLHYKTQSKAGDKRNEQVKLEDSIMFSENLSFLEEKFSFAKELVRIHRSYIININSVRKIHENRLWTGDTEIPIGKTYKDKIQERFRFI